MKRNVQSAKNQTNDIEAVQICLFHDFLYLCLRHVIYLITDLQLIQCTGYAGIFLIIAYMKPLLTRTRRKQGNTVFSGGAVQGLQALMKGNRNMGISICGNQMHDS